MKKLIYILCVLSIFSISFAKNIRLKEPPEELEKYYPPNSDKYEFLMTMYKLSTAFKGIVVNISEGKWAQAKSWAEELSKNYTKIGELVPTWKKVLRENAAKNLVKAVESKDSTQIRKYMNTVGKTCMQCHKNYQLSVKIKYHYPSYDGTSIEDPISGVEYSVHDYMKKMTDDMKLLKIYLLEKEKNKAIKAGDRFVKRVKGLTQMCSDCHTNNISEKVYFNDDLDKKLQNLRDAVENEHLNEVFSNLSWINNNNCMKCHNVHQIPAMLKEKFESEKNH